MSKKFVIIIIPLVVIIVFVVSHKVRDHQIYQTLSKGASSLATPTGCNIDSQGHDSGDPIDSLPSWNVTYTCKDVTADAAYQDILISLKSQNYKAIADFTIPNPDTSRSFYDFNYHNKEYDAKYVFKYDGEQPQPTVPPDTLITGITLVLIKNRLP